jgi:hypothetical protein
MSSATMPSTMPSELRFMFSVDCMLARMPVTTTVGALVVLSVGLAASCAWAIDKVAQAPATAILIRRRRTGSLENVFKVRCILSPYL